MTRGVQRRRLVVCGMMGQIPFAGMAWQALHYIEGFRRLGHDVTYIEDTRMWPSNDCEYIVNYLAELMTRSGLPQAWAYRAEAKGGAFFGLTEWEVARRLEHADALINLHGITELRDTYLKVPVRIYLETDPVAPQVAIAKGERRTIETPRRTHPPLHVRREYRRTRKRCSQPALPIRSDATACRPGLVGVERRTDRDFGSIHDHRELATNRA
jgi:hypothetical protein